MFGPVQEEEEAAVLLHDGHGAEVHLLQQEGVQLRRGEGLAQPLWGRGGGVPSPEISSHCRTINLFSVPPPVPGVVSVSVSAGGAEEAAEDIELSGHSAGFLC